MICQYLAWTVAGRKNFGLISPGPRLEDVLQWSRRRDGMEGLILTLVDVIQVGLWMRDPKCVPTARSIFDKTVVVGDPLVIVLTRNQLPHAGTGKDIAFGLIDVDILHIDSRGNRIGATSLGHLRVGGMRRSANNDRQDGNGKWGFAYHDQPTIQDLFIHDSSGGASLTLDPPSVVRASVNSF